MKGNIPTFNRKNSSQLAAGSKCERSELPFESRACSGVHTLDYFEDCRNYS